MNSCVLPEPLSHEEVGLLMTWIEPIKEKTIDYETLEAKLAVLLEVSQSWDRNGSGESMPVLALALQLTKAIH